MRVPSVTEESSVTVLGRDICRKVCNRIHAVGYAVVCPIRCQIETSTPRTFPNENRLPDDGVFIARCVSRIPDDIALCINCLSIRRSKSAGEELLQIDRAGRRAAPEQRVIETSRGCAIADLLHAIGAIGPRPGETVGVQIDRAVCRTAPKHCVIGAEIIPADLLRAADADGS